MLAGLLPATLAIAERRRLEELINELRTNVANWLEAEGTQLEEVVPEKQPPTDMSKNIGHNWRSPLDKEYDRLVDLAAVAMIGAANKPELSKHFCAYAQEALRGGAALSRTAVILCATSLLRCMATSPTVPRKSISANCAAKFRPKSWRR